MSSHHSNLPGSGARALSSDELVALFGETTRDDRARQAAIACYLSAGEGWRQAAEELGGAFAAMGSILRERKPG